MDRNDCIFFQLAKVNQLAGKFLGQKVAALNITPVQALVLNILNHADHITASELGKMTELDSATLTGIIDRLEAAELIERRTNPVDRRSIRIHLTQKGITVSSQAALMIAKANQEFLKDVSETQKRDLFKIIEKIRQQKIKA